SLCLHEANSPSSPHEDHRISVTHVFPQLFDEAHRPPGPSVPYVRITVSSVEPRRQRGRGAAKAPTVLEERIVASEPAAWDASIPFIEPDAVARAALELLRKHFPRVMVSEWVPAGDPITRLKGGSSSPSMSFRGCTSTSGRSIECGGIAVPGAAAPASTLHS